MMDAQPVTDEPGGPGAAVATPGVGIVGRHVFKAETVGGACNVCGGGFGEFQHTCAFDGCAPLVGRQKSFATNACRTRWWDREHPRVNPPSEAVNLPLAGSIKDRIRELMADGLQRTTQQIAYDLRIGEATCSRELRKLRDKGVAVQTAALRGPRKPAVYWIPRDQPAGQV